MIFQGFDLLMQRTCLDNVCFPWSSSAPSAPRRGNGPRSCWTWWAWETGRGLSPPSSPAARSSG